VSATADNNDEHKQKIVAGVTGMKIGKDVSSSNRHEYSNNGNFQAQKWAPIFHERFSHFGSRKLAKDCVLSFYL
jgi:hypothetical protein